MMMRAVTTAIALLVGSPALAAQIVALNIKPAGEVPAALTESLTPLLIAEVSRHEGMSVVSAFDVRAFLENEGNKQALGCGDTACMTQVAGALGAEMLLSSTLSRVDETWICTLTLIRVETAEAVRRSVGKHRGSARAASEAVTLAVGNLFRDGLPGELMGPRSMAFRGFRAVLLGFSKAVLERSADAKSLRRRIILDLVNTELEYDVDPKLGQFFEMRPYEVDAINKRMLLAADDEEMARLLAARRQWIAIQHDVERVKEIRTRAQARGLVPTARALRFEEPEPTSWPPLGDISRYRQEATKARKLAERGLRAIATGDQAAFVKLYLTDRQGRGANEWKRHRKAVAEGRERFDLLPFHAMQPSQYGAAIKALDDGSPQLLVYLRRFYKGRAVGTRTVRFERADSAWKVHTW
jgi:hypothetical protein